METNSKLFKTSILIMLFICTGLLLKQQYDIYQIKRDLSYIEGEVESTKSELNNVNSELSEKMDDLSSEIDGVRRAVIVWSD